MIPVPIDSPASSPLPTSALIVTTDGPTAAATAPTSICGRAPARVATSRVWRDGTAGGAGVRSMSCLPIKTPTVPAANATVAIAMAEPATSCHLVAGGRWSGPIGKGGGSNGAGAVSRVAGSSARCSTTWIPAARGASRSVPVHRPCSLTAVGSSKAPSSPPPRSPCLHSCFTPTLQPRHGVAVDFAIEPLRTGR